MRTGTFAVVVGRALAISLTRERLGSTAVDQQTQETAKGDRHDEINDPACCDRIAVRAYQSGLGATRDLQSGLVCPVLSERELSELRTR